MPHSIDRCTDGGHLRYVRRATWSTPPRSGVWAANADDGSGATTFTLDECAALTDEMLGWMLQPDVNEQVYLPITSVDPDGSTVTVAGDCKSIGSKDTAFRIYAPPGVERSNIDVSLGIGALTLGPGGASSRHLFAGYRYEAPLAGIGENVNVGTEDEPVWELQIHHRQSGKNFAGQHYTLFRHYDPVLMRFTSPDPAASPFYNLYHYAGNSPARFAPALDPPEQADAGAGRESCGRLGLMGMETRDPSDLHDTFGVVHWVS